jgi:chaperonin GroEL
MTPAPRKPAVVFQPKTYHQLKKGIDLVADAVRPTLGPLPRLVAVEKFNGKELPEFLDDGATIARRIIQVKPRSADVGAMLIRHALWKMHTEAGDGTVTMAVLYQALFGEGVRAVTQLGSNPMLLRAGLEKGREAVLGCLRESAVPLAGKAQIAAIAHGMVQGDAEMADILGEIFDIVGPEGLIVVEGGNRRGIEREYIEGTYWELSGWFSRHLVTDLTEKKAAFEDSAIFISDLSLTDPAQLVPVLEKCVRGGVKKLVIVAKEVSDRVIGLLVNNNAAKTIRTLAVRTPRILEMDRVAAMEDIAVLTGGRIFYSAAKTNLEDFRVEDLGQARRAWATDNLFGIFGGKGDSRRVRQHIKHVQGKLSLAELESEREAVQKRIGRLLGGTAILRVGGMTETEREIRKEMANRAVAGLRNAVRSGVVAGGGAALLHARAALDGLPAGNEDESTAYKILRRALEEPLRAIAQNAGFQPDVVIEKIKDAPEGTGFDARSGKIVDMRENGILDAVLVLVKALEIAASGAALALTTDVLVHHRKPVETVEP